MGKHGWEVFYIKMALPDPDGGGHWNCERGGFGRAELVACIRGE